MFDNVTFFLMLRIKTGRYQSMLYDDSGHRRQWILSCLCVAAFSEVARESVS